MLTLNCLKNCPHPTKTQPKFKLSVCHNRACNVTLIRETLGVWLLKFSGEGLVQQRLFQRRQRGIDQRSFVHGMGGWFTRNRGDFPLAMDTSPPAIDAQSPPIRVRTRKPSRSPRFFDKRQMRRSNRNGSQESKTARSRRESGASKVEVKCG